MLVSVCQFGEGLGFVSEAASSQQVQTVGLEVTLPLAFFNIKTVPVAEEMFQVKVLKKMFSGSYYLENKMLP